MGVRAVVTGVAVGLVLVTGCSGGPEQPAATVTPSTVPSTPMASSSPDPSQDPLYLEAVGVYTAYFKEMQKFEAAQYPSDTLPKEMDKYIVGAMRGAIEDSIVNSRRDHVAPKRGTSSTLAWVRPNPGVSRSGSIISIAACSDGSGVEVVDTVSGESLGEGASVKRVVYFKRVDGNLMGFLSEAEESDSCDAT